MGTERASALVLVPSMVLVLLCLGGIAVDLTLLHGAHRAAHRLVSAAADDGAAMIDAEELQVTGELRIDPERAQRVALTELERGAMPGRLLGRPTVLVDPGGAVLTVAAEIEVEHVMLRALPGLGAPERLTIRARGRLNR